MLDSISYVRLPSIIRLFDNQVFFLAIPTSLILQRLIMVEIRTNSAKSHLCQVYISESSLVDLFYCTDFLLYLYIVQNKPVFWLRPFNFTFQLILDILFLELVHFDIFFDFFILGVKVVECIPVNGTKQLFGRWVVVTHVEQALVLPLDRLIYKLFVW